VAIQGSNQGGVQRRISQGPATTLCVCMCVRVCVCAGQLCVCVLQVCRAHQVVEDGYEFFADRQVPCRTHPHTPLSGAPTHCILTHSLTVLTPSLYDAHPSLYDWPPTYSPVHKHCAYSEGCVYREALPVRYPVYMYGKSYRVGCAYIDTYLRTAQPTAPQARPCQMHPDLSGMHNVMYGGLRTFALLDHLF
jgi:hypothetical protein